MEKRALHSLVKAAARNAYRKHAVKEVVKTAAAALRKRDLKGAILARVNGEKSAAPLKIPGKLFNRVGQFFTMAGKDGLRPALSKARGVISRGIASHGGLLGAARRGAYLAGKDMLELGRRGYGGMKRRIGEFADNASGNRLGRFIETIGLKPGSPEAKEFLRRAGQSSGYGEGLSRADVAGRMADDMKGITDYVKNVGNVGTDTMAGSQRIAKRLKAEMWRARRNAALMAAGGVGAYGLAHEPGVD